MTPLEEDSAIAAEVDDTPPIIALLAISIAETIASAFIITGIKKMARTSVLPGNFLFNSKAINKLKKTISGTSIKISCKDVTRVCENCGCFVNSYTKFSSATKRREYPPTPGVIVTSERANWIVIIKLRT